MLETVEVLLCEWLSRRLVLTGVVRVGRERPQLSVQGRTTPLCPATAALGLHQRAQHHHAQGFNIVNVVCCIPVGFSTKLNWQDVFHHFSVVVERLDCVCTICLLIWAVCAGWLWKNIILTWAAFTLHDLWYNSHSMRACWLLVCVVSWCARFLSVDSAVNVSVLVTVVVVSLLCSLIYVWFIFTCRTLYVWWLHGVKFKAQWRHVCVKVPLNPSQPTNQPTC